MTADITQDPRVRRWLLIAAAIFTILAGMFYLSIRDYQRNFMEMTPDQVIAVIGPPDSDDRKGTLESPREFMLAWKYSLGLRLFLQFQDGVVVRRGDGSR